MNSGNCTYKRGSSMWGHLNILHPTKWQQHHLQVEQVSCQVACALSNVKAQSREERTYRKIFVLLLLLVAAATKMLQLTAESKCTLVVWQSSPGETSWCSYWILKHTDIKLLTSKVKYIYYITDNMIAVYQ